MLFSQYISKILIQDVRNDIDCDEEFFVELSLKFLIKLKNIIFYEFNYELHIIIFYIRLYYDINTDTILWCRLSVEKLLHNRELRMFCI